MDERDVLQHLLEVESNASTLVDDAQAEADRRIAEAEKRNRLRYEEQYNEAAAELNREYALKTAETREDYTRQLEAYRKSLDTMRVNRDDFYRLIEQISAGE
jgi:vacuolar-type H+-ATPase subunit H